MVASIIVNKKIKLDTGYTIWYIRGMETKRHSATGEGEMMNSTEGIKCPKCKSITLSIETSRLRTWEPSSPCICGAVGCEFAGVVGDFIDNGAGVYGWPGHHLTNHQTKRL